MLPSNQSSRFCCASCDVWPVAILLLHVRVYPKAAVKALVALKTVILPLDQSGYRSSCYNSSRHRASRRGAAPCASAEHIHCKSACHTQSICVFFARNASVCGGIATFCSGTCADTQSMWAASLDAARVSACAS